jgi:hypothetical protein
MFGPAQSAILLSLAGSAVLALSVSAAETKPSEREAMYRRYLDFAGSGAGEPAALPKKAL